MAVLDEIAAVVGAGNLLAGQDAAPWAVDWTGAYRGEPLAVARPGSTAEVAGILSIAHRAGLRVVPAGGRTGLTGATHAPGALVLSLDRMARIRAIRPEARLAVAEAGVVLATLHAAAEEVNLRFPMTFGARGSAMLGGALSTNAGGSNVLRFGQARDLVLGLEVVLADGRILDLMSELRKDNTGYALRHLFMGAEGTLGVITAAAVKLVPRPRAFATAMVAVPSLPAALTLLRRLDEETGGGVEAFEYMPRHYVQTHLARIPGAREPFARAYEHNVMIEAATTVAREAEPGPDGTIPFVEAVEAVLAGAMEEGLVLDAAVARSEAQRREIWARREAAAEITHGRHPFVDTDVALPLDRVEDFLREVRAGLKALDPAAEDFVVAHLGDGNVHYSVYPTRDDEGLMEAIRAMVDRTAVALGGSFSAEHGIGLAKRSSMAALKDPVALDVMRAVKAALDPAGLLNPGKVLPPA
ncbi:FAD/FMN-containing dehydrogenase [Rubellimicrobium thermophilum DSM 16684]|uniref:FAD/FMN-containing dehydrogenase n=1 Tax=Rubellimicrobium thermophilum DSM 16684 TaxID=1123069 RepID=S9QPL7_9RHOB|nr:FAD-binding oxidoreductase [Rubellimicrobium thermophilum]EPX83391.1 FAD/FMN-containing dehydrogenase [Rubellimicrobium thermophilum DSM 16684]